MAHKTFRNFEDIPKLGNCPVCGEPLKRFFGSGWDWDLALCPNKECTYSEELDAMTVEEGGVYIQFERRD